MGGGGGDIVVAGSQKASPEPALIEQGGEVAWPRTACMQRGMCAGKGCGVLDKMLLDRFAQATI